jgi:hypothetical protein
MTVYCQITDLWPGDPTGGQSLVNGSFKGENYVFSLKEASCFLANSYECPQDIMHFLHSFDWLRDLRALGTNASRKRTRELILYWIDSNHSLRKKSWLSPAWHPGIIGQRLRCWLSMYDFFGASADENFRREFFRSLNHQFHYLQKTYKSLNRTSWYYSQALTGLIFFTCCLEKSPKQLEIYLKELEKTLSEQFLQDGGHISRSPKIHFLILRDLIDIRTLLRTSALIPEPSFLQQAIQHIAPLIRFFRHSDGELADFQGLLTPLESLRLQFYKVSAATVDMVLSLSDARPRQIQRAQDTGYERFSSKGGLILLNTKKETSAREEEDQGLGILNFQWSAPPYGFICSNDVVIYTMKGQPIYIRNNKELPPGFIQIKRQQKEGHNHLRAHFDYQLENCTVQLNRELYIAPEPGDFRGSESILLDCEGIISIRFTFCRTAVLVSKSTRSVMIKFKPRKVNLEESYAPNTWRLVCTGKEEVFTQTLSDGRLEVILMMSLEPYQEKKMKWAFHLS